MKREQFISTKETFSRMVMIILNMNTKHRSIKFHKTNKKLKPKINTNTMILGDFSTMILKIDR